MNPQAVQPAVTYFGLPLAALVAILVIVVVVVFVGIFLSRRGDIGHNAVANALLPPKPIGPNPIEQLHAQGLIRDPDVLAIKDAIAKDDAIQAARAGLGGGGGPPPVPTTYSVGSLKPSTDAAGGTVPPPSTATASVSPPSGLAGLVPKQ